jgi:CHAT domain-containing protein
LVVSSEAGVIGLPQLAEQAEQAELTAALEPLQRQGKLQVEWLTGAVTRRALQDTLRRWQPHLLHYIGHGYFDEPNVAGRAEGGLLLARETASGRYEPDPVSATELAVLFDGGRLRLALLNACRTGQAAGGVAAALVKACLPLVVGMQADVPDGVAVTFAGAFYRALADGWPVEAAVAEGRRLLALEEGLAETAWAMPVLYGRG